MRVWDAADGRCLEVFHSGGAITAAAWASCPVRAQGGQPGREVAFALGLQSGALRLVSAPAGFTAGAAAGAGGATGADAAPGAGADGGAGGGGGGDAPSTGGSGAVAADATPPAAAGSS